MLRNCLILGVRDYKENSLLVTILHPQLGRQEFLAKGAKRISAKLTPWLMPLTIVDLWITTSKHDLPIIREVQEVESLLPKEYLPLRFALKAASMLQEVTYPYLEADDLMRGILRILRFITTRGLDAKRLTKVWITFELEILAFLGVRPDTTRLGEDNLDTLARSLERKIYQFAR